MVAQDSIAILEDPQVEFHLLHNCLVAANLSIFVQYLLLYCILEQFDLNLQTCLSRILQCSYPHDSWCQAYLGGLVLLTILL